MYSRLSRARTCVVITILALCPYIAEVGDCCSRGDTEEKKTNQKTPHKKNATTQSWYI